MTIPEDKQPSQIPGDPVLTRYERSLILCRLDPTDPDQRAIGRKLATTTDWLTVFDDGQDQATTDG